MSHGIALNPSLCDIHVWTWKCWVRIARDCLRAHVSPRSHHKDHEKIKNSSLFFHDACHWLEPCVIVVVVPWSVELGLSYRLTPHNLGMLVWSIELRSNFQFWSSNSDPNWKLAWKLKSHRLCSQSAPRPRLIAKLRAVALGRQGFCGRREAAAAAQLPGMKNSSLLSMSSQWSKLKGMNDVDWRGINPALLQHIFPNTLHDQRARSMTIQGTNPGAVAATSFINILVGMKWSH